MADRAELLRQFRERNYNTAKGKPAPLTEPVEMEVLQKIVQEVNKPNGKKQLRIPVGKKESKQNTPEKKKRGPRGPYKKRKK